MRRRTTTECNDDCRRPLNARNGSECGQLGSVDHDDTLQYLGKRGVGDALQRHMNIIYVRVDLRVTPTHYYHTHLYKKKQKTYTHTHSYQIIVQNYSNLM